MENKAIVENNKFCEQINYIVQMETDKSTEPIHTEIQTMLKGDANVSSMYAQQEEITYNPHSYDVQN